MQYPDWPDNEPHRQKALEELSILDTAKDKDFDDIVELAAVLCEVPMSLISLVDKDRQWFKARKGVSFIEGDRAVSFCAHTIYYNELFEVSDALTDDRFKDNPLVLNDPFIRFYAGAPLKTSDGLPLGTLCILDNKPKNLTTPQKKTLQVLARRVVKEMELKKEVLEITGSKERLNELNEFKTTLISILGHDLKAPINSIRGVLELLDSNILSNEEIQETRSSLRLEVNNVSKLLDNVMHWSRLHIQKNSLNFKTFVASEVIDECIQLLQFEANKKELNIHHQSENVTIYGDQEMVKLIIRNLLNNAIKFCRKNDSIAISAIAITDKVRLCIKDSGIGMTPEQVSNLKSSQKVGESHPGTKSERGAGLGLLLTKKFIAAHNGKLEIESTPNKGSTFYVTLPRKA